MKCVSQRSGLLRKQHTVPIKIEREGEEKIQVALERAAPYARYQSDGQGRESL